MTTTTRKEPPMPIQVTDTHRALAREIAREVEGHAHGYEVSSASAIEHIARKIAEDEAEGAPTAGDWYITGRVGSRLTIASDARYIAVVSDQPDDSTEHAIAQLIAAAPALLAVARAIVEAWDGTDKGDWRGALDEAKKMASAAISKATQA